VGHEYDRDKPPYAVSARISAQGRDLFQVDSEVSNMGLYVALVASQVEAFLGPPFMGNPHGQAVYGLC